MATVKSYLESLRYYYTFLLCEMPEIIQFKQQDVINCVEKESRAMVKVLKYI